MFNRQKIAQLENNQREQIIAKGKARYVRREIGFSVLFFAMLMIVFYLGEGRTRVALLSGVAVFLIGILGGYLHAIWKWQDITRSRY
jgi:hypothetical protein